METNIHLFLGAQSSLPTVVTHDSTSRFRQAVAAWAFGFAQPLVSKVGRSFHRIAVGLASPRLLQGLAAGFASAALLPLCRGAFAMFAVFL
ncbi:MAG TPA: hypothetical protein VGG33_23350 [Polyangia bacterium]